MALTRASIARLLFCLVWLCCVASCYSWCLCEPALLFSWPAWVFGPFLLPPLIACRGIVVLSHPPTQPSLSGPFFLCCLPSLAFGFFSCQSCLPAKALAALFVAPGVWLMLFCARASLASLPALQPLLGVSCHPLLSCCSLVVVAFACGFLRSVQFQKIYTSTSTKQCLTLGATESAQSSLLAPGVH